MNLGEPKGHEEVTVRFSAPPYAEQTKGGRAKGRTVTRQ